MPLPASLREELAFTDVKNRDSFVLLAVKLLSFRTIRWIG